VAALGSPIFCAGKNGAHPLCGTVLEHKVASSIGMSYLSLPGMGSALHPVAYIVDILECLFARLRHPRSRRSGCSTLLALTFDRDDFLSPKGDSISWSVVGLSTGLAAVDNSSSILVDHRLAKFGMTRRLVARSVLVIAVRVAGWSLYNFSLCLPKADTCELLSCTSNPPARS